MVRWQRGHARHPAVDDLSLYEASTVEALTLPIRFQRGPVSFQPGKETGERKLARSNAVRGSPPAKTCRWTQAGSVHLPMPAPKSRPRCLCHTREGASSRIRPSAARSCRTPQRRSRESPPGGTTLVRRPTGAGGSYERRCLCLTRELIHRFPLWPQPPLPGWRCTLRGFTRQNLNTSRIGTRKPSRTPPGPRTPPTKVFIRTR